MRKSRQPSRLPLPLDQPVGSQLQEFGHGFQVPIGIVHMDVPQIGGQLGEFSFHLESGAIPVDQGAGGESVPQIMQPGAATVTLSGPAKAQLLRQLGEGVSRHPLGGPAAPLGDEERRSARCRKEAISDLGVLFQSVYGGGMNRHVA